VRLRVFLSACGWYGGISLAIFPLPLPVPTVKPEWTRPPSPSPPQQSGLYSSRV
jgi:hypothetical protein